MLGILKVLILFLILFVCSNIGILKAKTYQNRVVELKKIKSALGIFKSKIEFTYEPIKDIFLEISDMIYKTKENIFKETVQNMNNYSVTESWNIAVEKNINLNREDKVTIKMFGNLLGKTDKSGQVNEINITNELIDSLIEKAEQENNKNYKLFKTLGVIVGVALCIVFI